MNSDSGSAARHGPAEPSARHRGPVPGAASYLQGTPSYPQGTPSYPQGTPSYPSSSTAYPRRRPSSEALRLRDLDTRLLLTFRAVAVEGTFGAAAALLGYSQPAVSQQIAQFERLVGAPVFHRPGGPRPVELTPLGEVLFDRVGELVAVLESIAADAQRFQSGDLGRVHIGTIQSTSTGLLPTILRRLLGERPALQTRMEERYNETDLVDLLLRGDLDVTFLVSGDPPGVDSVEVLVDPFVVLAREEDVGNGPVTPAQLTEHMLIGQLGSAYQENMIDVGLRDLGHEPRYIFRTADNGAVVSMVRAGLGVALLPRLAVLDEFDDPRLAVRPLEPPIADRVIRLAWRSGRDLSPVAERFVEITMEVARELDKRYVATPLVT